MKRLNKLGIMLVLPVLLVLLGSCAESSEADDKQEQKAESKKLNVVYIMADDLAYQAISAYGHPISQLAPTPNIDRIANEGALVSGAYCTNSICGPSRACILTGNMSHINGFYKNVDGGDFDSTQATFPKVFTKSGYQTAVVGKWHLGTPPAGVDYSKVLINYGGQGTYYNPVFAENGKDTIREKGKYSTHVIAESALSWLDKRDTSKPFALVYQFKAPHRPWRPAPEYRDLYEDITFPEPDNFNDDYAGRKAASENWMTIEQYMNRRDLKVWPPKGVSTEDSLAWLNTGFNGKMWTPHDSLQGAELKSWKFQRYIKDYLRCVAAVDAAVGKLLDYLDENGLADNTVIMLTSDQGFYLGEHGWFDKRWIYEESFRTPLMVKAPGKIKPGTKVQGMVMNIDFGPTLLDFCGLSMDVEVQGKSFKELLETGSQTKERDAVYYHYYEWPKWHKVQPHYGLRTSKYKLAHFYYNMDEWELYDCESDPTEMNNLYGKEGYEQITEDLKKRLAELQVEYGDTVSLADRRKMTDVKIPRSYAEPH